MRNRWAFIVSVLAALPTFTVVMPASPAAAAPGCVASGCNGKVAAAMGCVPGSFAIAGLSVKDNPNGAQVASGDLYYSPACQSAWGDYRTTSPNDARTIVLYTQPTFGGPEVRRYEEFSEGSSVVTTMVNWDESVKLCAQGRMEALRS